MNLSPIVDHGYLLGLGDDDHPQYLHLNKAAQTLQQNLAVTGGVTIDGVDISAHAANVSAHHARYTDAEAVAAAEAKDPFTHAGAVNIGGILTVNNIGVANQYLIDDRPNEESLFRLRSRNAADTAYLHADIACYAEGGYLGFKVPYNDTPGNGYRLKIHSDGNVEVVNGNIAMAALKTVDGVDISAHAANVSAHHARYTDAEAVAAAEAKDPFDHAGAVNIGGLLTVNNANIANQYLINSVAGQESLFRLRSRNAADTAYLYADIACYAEGGYLGFKVPYNDTPGSGYRVKIHSDGNFEIVNGNLSMVATKTVDGVDISEFVKAFNAKARAWRNGLQNINTDTITIVQLGNESYDPGGNFSTATYRLTAPYSGYYGFSTMTMFTHNHPANQLPADKAFQVFLYKNNATRLLNAGTHSSWGGGVGCAASDKYYLAANDYMDMRVWHNGGITIELWGEEHSTFMVAHLLSKV